MEGPRPVLREAPPADGVLEGPWALPCVLGGLDAQRDGALHGAVGGGDEERYPVVHDQDMPLRELRGEGVEGLDPHGVPASEVHHDVFVQAGVMLLALNEELGSVLALGVAEPCTYTSTNTNTSICASNIISLY